MITRPQFSILHTSARPESWRAVYDDWMSKAAFPERVEYVLCIDTRWGFVGVEAEFVEAPNRRLVQVVNHGRRCYVDGVNTAARHSSGSILVVNADDQFACESWDVELLKRWKGGDDFVIEVSTGTPDEHERAIMVMPVLSRARYERLGYVFYPAYESMFADNDFAAHAVADGVVLDGRSLVFPHRHPLFDATVKIDPQYQAQNRPEAFRLGKALYDCRVANGFGPVSAVDLVLSLDSASGPGRSSNGAAGDAAGGIAGSGVAADGRTIALCFSGEMFRGEWFDAILTLYSHLVAMRGFNVIRLRNYTTNVYVTRLEVWEALQESPVRPDLMLWIDDDNPVLPEHFDQLLADLDARADVDAVTAWCWVHDRDQLRFQVSCGQWAPDGAHWVPFDPVEFMGSKGLRSVEVTGFPCLLMRGSVLDKIGERPFLRGILDDRLKHGIGGEDLAFCRACRGVVSIVADPAVRVPHMKWMQVIPEFAQPAAEKQTPRLAVTMRVRNEGRWIERVVKSFLAVGPVFVMDDHSTDSTVELAARAGATVWSSPFPADDLDERRDKNWLLDRVKAECSPEWVFCPDGDEELQRGGADMIVRACASGVADAYAVRFLYLWDAPNRVRVDRWYSTFSRFSLFRVRDGLAFKSLYEGRGVHAGLHTGNSPLGDGPTKTAVLNVYLLHYGYMNQADRVRKFEYYNRIDPNNTIEDCYRHIVQGDVPEVPAAEVLLHAGPLDVRELPASLAPEDWGAAVV